MLLKRVIKGIHSELSNFLLMLNSATPCTKQSFSKARTKLNHSAFIALNQMYVEDFYSSTDVEYYKKKYILLAVDGSLVQLPNQEELGVHFGTWKNKSDQTMPMVRASLIYDVLNRVILYSSFSALKESETDIFREQYKAYKNAPFSKKSVFLMDRGYPSHDLCTKINTQGDAFVIRCKSTFCKSVKEFDASSKTEARIVLSPTVWYTRKGVKRQSESNEPLEVKIVRIELDGGSTEYLITNLEASVEELKYLYSLRWGVETLYDYLKNTLELENVSSKKVEGVLQDFYACVFTCNITHLLIREADKELKQEQKQKNKYNYQVNRATAASILRNEIIKLLFLEEDIGGRLALLKEHIKVNPTAIIPNRKFKRHKLKRTRRKYHFSKKTHL